MTWVVGRTVLVLGLRWYGVYLVSVSCIYRLQRTKLTNRSRMNIRRAGHEHTIAGKPLRCQRRLQESIDAARSSPATHSAFQRAREDEKQSTGSERLSNLLL